MRIVVLGESDSRLRWVSIPFETVPFFSSKTLLDADIVLWDMQESMNEVKQHKRKSTRTHRSYLPENTYEKLNNQFHERKEELRELVFNGKSVFVQLHPTPTVGATVGNPGYIGSTRKEWDLLQLLAMQPCKLVAKEGENIEYIEDIPFTPVLSPEYSSLNYAAVIKEAEGTPLLRIKGSKHVVGQVIQRNKGYIFLMPQFKWKILGAKAGEDTTTFLQNLLDLAKVYPKPKLGKPTPPLWVQQHVLPGEQEDKYKLDELLRQKQALEISTDSQKDALQQYNTLRILLWGSGQDLEAACMKIFSELGFTIEPPVPGRADLILYYESTPAVVECKGVKGSAAEAHAAQLGKWVDTYNHDKKVMPKGILLINTFKEKPVGERKEQHFPDQMLAYCKQRGFCLITGEQLLNKYIACKTGNVTPDSVCKQLLSTIGVFEA